MLIRTAVAIESGGAKALRGRGSVTAAKPLLLSSVGDEPASSFAWQSEDAGDAPDLSCVLSAEDARSLLRIVLGGPSSGEPTPLERNIIRETAERLLAATGRAWEERPPERMPAGPAWRCELTLTDAVGTASSLVLCARACIPTPSASSRVDLAWVPIHLDASFPSVRMNVETIARWRTGDLVALGCDAGARVALASDGTSVASGALGSIRGRRAVLVDTHAAGGAS